MIVEALRRITAGIAVGGLYTFIVLSFVNFYGVDATVSEIWLSMLGSSWEP